jgi:glycosyltransferase involved in cell wall biosynthesis
LAAHRSQPAAPEPQISVVIPTLRNAELLGRVLDGYERQDVARGKFEVIVAIDRSEPDPDAVERVASGRALAARSVRGEHAGASGTRNAGWRAARSPVVLFTDDDTIPSPGLVAAHLRDHARYEQESVAVVGHVRWARGLRITPFMRWLEHGIQFDFGSISGTEASWAHLYSSNVSLKRGFLRRLGGFDAERFPYGHEDLDLGIRGHEIGMRVIYAPDAVVDHWRTMTVAQWRERAVRVGASERRFCATHPEVPAALHARFSEAAGRPAQRGRAALAAAVVPPSVPWLGPLIWNLADLYWRQQLAPGFLAGWEAEGRAGGASLDPAHAAVAERASP